MSLNIPTEQTLNWVFSRGRRITIRLDVLDTKGRVRAKRGARGVIVSEEPVDEKVSVRLDNKHYAVRDCPLNNLMAHLDI